MPAARAVKHWQAWENYRLGTSAAPKYPLGSVGDAFDRLRNTPDIWGIKSNATREEWEYAWSFIEPHFAKARPQIIEVEMLTALRKKVLAGHGAHAAFKVIKIWRTLWSVMAAYKLCDRDADPSKAFENPAPPPRDQTWSEGELARLGKHAWRSGYKGLAALIAVI